MTYVNHCDSPLGGMTMLSDGEALTALLFDDRPGLIRKITDGAAANTGPTVLIEAELPVFIETKRWLEVYFGGGEPDFTPPLAPGGTGFQREVFALLTEIPYGRTVSYGELAAKLAGIRCVKRMSAQAVGGAVGRNPIAVIIPCHRVIGADGSLTGYGGGLDKKSFLLELEKHARR